MFAQNKPTAFSAVPKTVAVTSMMSSTGKPAQGAALNLVRHTMTSIHLDNFSSLFLFHA